jgi:hypothetical protein
MGSITRGLSNNITTGGVILPAGITNASVSAVTSFANASGGTLTLLSTQTASASATISFTTGLDSTYDEYIFKFINVRSATSNIIFQFNLSTDGGSNYNVTKTTTFFRARHREDDSATALAYNTSEDLAQSTGFQTLVFDTGNDADDNNSGEMCLYNPSSTTYVKHFISRISNTNITAQAGDNFIAGYANTTSAVNAIQFKMSSGNIADGIFKLYGVKKS